MSVCPRCEARVASGVLRCPACQTALTAPSVPPPAPAPRRGAFMKVRIVRAEGGHETLVVLDKPSWTCGTQADFSIGDDPFLAAKQLRLTYTPEGGLIAEDSGGGNGVFLRIRRSLPLAVGNELRLGRQRLIVEAFPSPQVAGDATPWGSPDPGFTMRLVQVLEGGLRGSAYPLGEGETIIGREMGDILFPNDGFVSGKHAAIRLEGGRLEVRDLGSSNGTFIRMGQTSTVTPGDQFLIGRQLVRVEPHATS